VKLLHVIRSYLLLCCACLCIQVSDAAGLAEPEGLPLLPGSSASANPLSSLCLRFNGLNTSIRDNTIDSRSARIELRRILSEVRDEYHRTGVREYSKSNWVFPLAGYDARAIGGGRRHGYSARGYDYFSGNRHGGHPAFDIFIRDRNQGSLDDINGTPVNVLSLTGGVVVALEREWLLGSTLRGGKYLWIYDPANDLLVYYAHNGELSVGLGDIVKPGDVLASVGRSGYNAAKGRSPTHLHLMAVRVQDGRIMPHDIYRDLKRARLP